MESSREKQPPLEMVPDQDSAPKPTSRRKIIIDPAFMLFFGFHISSFTLAGQYIYYAIGERYNLTAILKDAANETSGGVCGEIIDRNTTAYKLQQQVQAEAANFNLFLDMFSEIPGFFVILFFGTLMDKLGRRPTLLLPMIGVILRALVYALQQALHLPLEILALGNFLDAMCGGIATFVTSCYAYYADTVPPAGRGRRLAFVDIGQTLGLAVMQITLGYMIQSWGFLWPYVLILSGHIVNLGYIWFFVPESRPNTGATWRDVSPLYTIRSFKILPKKRSNNGRVLLLTFILCWSVVQFGCMARHNVESLYKLNSPFCWEASLIGAFNGIFSIMTCMAQLFLTIVVLKRLGDIRVLYISLLSWIGYFVIQGAATTTWMLFLSAAVGVATGLQIPLMRGKLSQLVSSDEQGALFSTVCASDNILRIAGSALFNPLYGYTLTRGIFKGTAFVVMAGFVAIGLIILIVFQMLQKKEIKKAVAEDVKGYDNDIVLQSTKF